MSEPARPEITRLDPERSSPATPAVRHKASPRQILIGAIALLLALIGVWWLFDRVTNVYVLDARIAAEMVLVSSRVPGWITSQLAIEGGAVEQGDVLLRIDAREAQSRHDELNAAASALLADLATTRAMMQMVEARTASRWDAARARLTGAESELAAAESEFDVAASDWRRAGPLRERNVLSQQEWEADRNQYRTAMQGIKRNEARVATAKADVLEVESERAELKVLQAELTSLQARLQQKRLEVQRAAAALADHDLKSPISGVVDELFVDQGEYVAVGQRVLVMHDTTRQWINARVKETDIAYLAVGDEAQVTVDAYPEPRTGTITRIGNAATSQFALLPNPNPSGNFTKITQRVEVIITLGEHDPRLLPGMMVEVKIPRYRF